MAYNVWCGIGRLTADPVINETNSGKQVARFTLAVQGWQKDTANFIPCVAWGQKADFAGKYLSKGNKVGVNGSIETFSYEKDGVTHYGFNCNVQNFEFMQTKDSAGGGYNPRSSADDDAVGDDDQPFGDDLPF